MHHRRRLLETSPLQRDGIMAVGRRHGDGATTDRREGPPPSAEAPPPSAEVGPQPWRASGWGRGERRVGCRRDARAAGGGYVRTDLEARRGNS
jgi:hypothetical protein